MSQHLHHIIETIQTWWRRYWLLRWVVANMLGWSAALFIAVLLLQIFGLWGALIGGIVAGAVSAAAQTFVLRQCKTWTITRQQWVLWSAVGGGLATIPVYLLGFVALLHLTFGLLLMGAMFGGIVGAMQVRLLHVNVDDSAIWWAVACAAGGALCAPLTVTTAMILPVVGSLGPVAFGLISGLALQHVLCQHDD